ncbi:MAG: putative toxin-antitoxin system toxin component, PIN family [Candidatus Omnitrophica bacterium]|nr:putative toxin-antitoxin system toxin component, PIN family [Candidatus Omnitrophota bacterium]
MKVVLDTNVLVSGVFWRGPASRILELWANDRIEVVASPEMLTEYQRLLAVMERDKPAGLADAWAVFIAQHATVIHPAGHPRLCRDPDDDKFLHCALSAGVRTVVSGDKDLLSVDRLAEVEILTPTGFLRRYNYMR